MELISVLVIVAGLFIGRLVVAFKRAVELAWTRGDDYTVYYPGPAGMPRKRSK